LGSGSTGNALYMESGPTRVLIDAGLSAREVARRMSLVGLDPVQLEAVIVTHEHSDHVKGVRALSRTTGVPVLMSEPTRAECRFPENDIRWGQTISSSEPFQVGQIEFHPFSIPHDGVDTFGLTIHAEGIRVGLVTDLGHINRLVAEKLRGCDMIVIESNHDIDMLRAGPYPWPLKQRIASRLGHLSNDEVARWIREDFDGQAQYLVLAHLSRQCNHPELARLSALRALSSRGHSFFPGAEQRVKVAYHDRPTQWFEF
jgi:phosphoribosyl 1,2-cyclic phosphodiesterase